MYYSDKAMLNLKYICLPYNIKLLIEHWVTRYNSIHLI